MNVVDLGKMDLLIDQGFYSNRTDFIKTAIRNQISVHARDIDQVVTQSSFTIGVAYFSRKNLEKALAERKKLKITNVGLLIFSDDIDRELALKAINSVKAFGVLRANPELKEVLKSGIWDANER